VPRGESWTTEDEDALIDMYLDESTTAEMAAAFDKFPQAIRMKLRRLIRDGRVEARCAADKFCDMDAIFVAKVLEAGGYGVL
jgi:hypothetical protein